MYRGRFDPLQAMCDWNGKGAGLPNCQQFSVESMFRIGLKRTFRQWVNNQEAILELVGKQVCDTCKTMRNIPPSTCDLDMINSKFVLARRLNKPKLFFRRAVYSSARNKRDPEELLRTMQWSGEVWVFWFEYSPKPLIANQDKNEWSVNMNELIHHVCLVWYSETSH